MNNKLKNIVYSVLLLLVLVVVWYVRQPVEDGEVMFVGETMGTTYQVKYNGTAEDYKAEVDSILIDFNNSLSTYIPDSQISRFNKGAILKMESAERVNWRPGTSLCTESVSSCQCIRAPL